MQEQKPIFRVMKAISIQVHQWFFFEMNFCEKFGNLHKHVDFFDLKWSTKNCVDEPQM
jgi:hypothetical protein